MFTNRQLLPRNIFWHTRVGAPTVWGPCSAEHVGTLLNPALHKQRVNTLAYSVYYVIAVLSTVDSVQCTKLAQ